eukprot:Filipodium_phascolosomae@DN4558_c0_g2_i1.p1
MVKAKVSYFTIPARGEAVRIALHASPDMDWENVIVKSSEWAELKPKTPMQGLPVLELDGKQYCQSLALYKWAGKQGSGLYPKDSLEQLRVDEILHTVDDIYTKMPKSDAELRKAYCSAGGYGYKAG